MSTKEPVSKKKEETVESEKIIIRKENKTIIALSVLLFIFVVTTITFLVLWLLFYFWKENLVNATYVAAYNKDTCSSFSERCDIPSGDVSPPTIDIENDPPEFQKEFAVFCVRQVSAVEYYDDTSLSPGLTIVKSIKTNEVGAPIFGYVTVDSVKSYIYIIFRGTDTNLEWSEDYKFNQTTLSEIMTMGKKRKDIQKAFTVGGLCTDNVLIHSGFIEVFDQIKDQVADAVAEIVSSNNAIIVTGHSLGGAMASLISIYLKSLHPSMPITAYTFGKPRVGNQQYADCVNNNIDGFYRVQNSDDIVTTLPPAVSPNFVNHSEPFIYEHEGNAVDYQKNWGSWTLNHGVQSYLTYLETL